MIHFPCACGRELYARVEDIGRTTQCPSCDAISIIPAGDAPTPKTEDGIQTGPLVGDGAVPTPKAEDGIHADPPVRPSRASSREDSVDRPRRRRSEPTLTGTSGKAITAMLFGISALCLLLPSIPGAIFGILALRDIGKSGGRLGGKGMAITGIVLSCLSVLVMCPLGLLLPAVQKVRSAAQRMQESNNLKQMGLAMHNHYGMYGMFPQAAAFQDANGKPLLSWRVALLPYLEQEQLYRRFRLNEPWDSPNNKALLPLMPKVYGRPGDKPGDPNLVSGMTHYQVFVGPGSAFEPRSRLSPVDFTDGLSNTILIATSATPVPWTKPEDMPFDPTGPLPRLGGYFKGGSNICMADGSVRFLSEKVSDETLRLAIIRNDGQLLPSDW